MMLVLVVITTARGRLNRHRVDMNINIIPLYHHPQAAPNDPVTLRRGPVRLQHATGTVQGMGALVLRWFPTTGLRRECDVAPPETGVNLPRHVRDRLGELGIGSVHQPLHIDEARLDQANPGDERPLLPIMIHRAIRNTAQSAVGGRRRSPSERPPMPRWTRPDARPPSTPANLPNLPEARVPQSSQIVLPVRPPLVMRLPRSTRRSMSVPGSFRKLCRGRGSNPHGA